MATTAELLVEIKAKDSGLKRGLKSALSKTKKFVSDVKRNLIQLTKIVSASLVAAVGLITAAVSSSSAEIDKLVKTSEKLGIASEALQRLQFQSKLSGVSVETFNMALQRMVRRVAEASKGTGEAVGALKELNIDAAALARLSPDKQFDKIAMAFKNIGSQGDKVRLAMKLFDSEGVALVNTLNSNLAETKKQFEALGVTLTEQQKKAAVEFEDAKTRLGLLFDGFKQNVTAELAPVFTFLINQTQMFIKAQGGIKVIAKDVASSIVSSVLLMVQAFDALLRKIDQVKSGFALLKLGAKTIGESLGKGAAVAVQSIKGNFTGAGEILTSGPSERIIRAQDEFGASIDRARNKGPSSTASSLQGLLSNLQNRKESISASATTSNTKNRFEGLQSGTFQSGEVVIKIQADKDGIVNAVVNNEKVKGNIRTIVEQETNNAARATRR